MNQIHGNSSPHHVRGWNLNNIPIWKGLMHYNLNTVVMQPCNRCNTLGGTLKTDLPTAEKMNDRNNCETQETFCYHSNTSVCVYAYMCIYIYIYIYNLYNNHLSNNTLI
jgi:hypothetical protein